MIFNIPIAPKAWKRPGQNGRRRYTDPSQEAYQTTIKLRIINKINIHYTYLKEKLPIDAPVRVRFRFVFATTKRDRWSKPHIFVPDLSNLIKNIEDSLNNVLWKDDKLIYSIEDSDKIWGEEDMVSIEVKGW